MRGPRRSPLVAARPAADRALCRACSCFVTRSGLCRRPALPTLGTVSGLRHVPLRAASRKCRFLAGLGRVAPGHGTRLTAGPSPPAGSDMAGGSPIGRSVPERAELGAVVVLAAHAGLGCVPVAVADDQPPAVGDGTRPPCGYCHRAGDGAPRATAVVIDRMGLGHHGALAAAAAGDERERRGGTGGHERAEQSRSPAHVSTTGTASRLPAVSPELPVAGPVGAMVIRPDTGRSSQASCSPGAPVALPPRWPYDRVLLPGPVPCGGTAMVSRPVRQ